MWKSIEKCRNELYNLFDKKNKIIDLELVKKSRELDRLINKVYSQNCRKEIRGLL